MSENSPYEDEPIPYLPAIPDSILGEETIQERLDRMENRLAFIQGQVEATNLALGQIMQGMSQAVEFFEGLSGKGGGMLGKLIGL